MTMLEMIIVLALSLVLVVAFYSFLSTHLMSAAEESSEIRVQNDLRSTMSEIVQELEDAHLYFLDPMGNFICYQVPQLGDNGQAFKLDSTAANLGNPIYGAYPEGGGAFIPGGYYKLIFVDHPDERDLLIEPTMVAGGQNVSGTLSGVNNTVAYDKGFVFGHFEIECWTATGIPLSQATAYIGPPAQGIPGFAASTSTKVSTRVISGKSLRQLDLTDGSPVKRTLPGGGGFFYMRQTNAKLLYNATGAAAGTVWSPQLPDTFNDSNKNNVRDANESFTDVSLTGTFEEADCDPFTDTNFNGVFDKGDSTQLNAPWHGSLRVQLRSYDAAKRMDRNPNKRDSKSVIRTITTKVKIRN